PDLLQIAEVRQTFVDVEVFRIAEGSLSAQGTTLLEVLLEVKALVLNVKAWQNTILDHAGPNLPWRARQNPPIEDQLDPVGAPQIEVVPHHLLKELAATHRPIKDLRQAHLHLPDRQLPSVSCRAILARQGHRQPLQPTGQERFDLLRSQRITNLL